MKYQKERLFFHKTYNLEINDLTPEEFKSLQKAHEEFVNEAKKQAEEAAKRRDEAKRQAEIKRRAEQAQRARRQ